MKYNSNLNLMTNNYDYSRKIKELYFYESIKMG